MNSRFVLIWAAIVLVIALLVGMTYAMASLPPVITLAALGILFTGLLAWGLSWAIGRS